MSKKANIHIGEKIAEVLREKHLTRQQLGRMLGVSASAATYLTTRPSIDVGTLATISNLLKHDFFIHYPVNTDSAQTRNAEGIVSLKMRVEELEKNLESSRRDLVMQKQENSYLKKINDLLERKDK
jgi:transcriptional regulator with XRE-family HTH domain